MAHEGKNKKGSHFFDLSSQPHFIHDMVFSLYASWQQGINKYMPHGNRIYLLDHTNMKKIVADFSGDNNKSSTLMKLMVI